MLDIVWEKRPRWLNDERLYTLACCALPNDRKCGILDALASHNERDVVALKIPKSMQAYLRVMTYINNDSLMFNVLKLQMFLKVTHRSLGIGYDGRSYGTSL